MTKTLIEQLTAVITAIAEDISNNSGSNDISDSSDISVLLPRKIGASQRWYQSGLRYGAEYPNPYAVLGLNTISGQQYFVPFTAFEDVTINALEVYCNVGRASATVSLGIYASDSNNDLSNPLFTSSPIDCSTVGVKNASCNVQITKGKVYWLSSLATGTPGFYRNGPDSLPSIKGVTTAAQSIIIGYVTTNNTQIATTTPENKTDWTSYVPRVMFVVA